MRPGLQDRLADGDGAAWAEFIDRYMGVFRAAVVKTLGRSAMGERPEDVADVLQEVFVRLCQNDGRLLRAFRPERSAFTTWLTMVARSVAVDWLRRRRPAAASLDEVDDPIARGAASAEAIELPPGLLSRRQQLVLRLLFDQDLSVEEVAGVLGIAPQTVRSTKHNAISALRAHYGVSPSGRPARQGGG